MNTVTQHAKRVTVRSNPFGLSVALVLMSAAIAFGVVALIRPSPPTVKTSRRAINGPARPTVDAPLYGAKAVTMAEATKAFGSQLALPSISVVRPTDAGAIWESVHPGEATATVAVTFPSRGIFIDYIKPAPFSDPASGYKEMTAAFAVSQVVNLNGTTPALYVEQNSDDTGANFGSVTFEANGAEIRVLGHNDQATLEAIAQSILEQLQSPPSS